MPFFKHLEQGGVPLVGRLHRILCRLHSSHAFTRLDSWATNLAGGVADAPPLFPEVALDFSDIVKMQPERWPKCLLSWCYASLLVEEAK
jgi:hypothetical protein